MSASEHLATIERAWATVSRESPTDGLAAVGPFEDAKSELVQDVRLAVSPHGTRHLLAPVPNAGAFVSDRRSKGVSLVRRAWSEDGRTRQYADLSCARQDLFPQFSAICSDVIDSLARIDGRADQTIGGVLHRWRDLLAKGGAPLSTEVLMGVYCELLVLSDLVEIDPRSIHLWTGPDRSLHDFVSGNAGIEVKGTRGNSEPSILIHGENQLSRRPGPLWLAWIRLERNPKGASLSQLRERILKLGVDGSALDAKIRRVGIDLEILDEIEDVRFRVVEQRNYLVDHHFPRLTPEAFKDARLPKGVSELTYRVDLSGVAWMGDDLWSKALHQMVTGLDESS